MRNYVAYRGYSSLFSFLSPPYSSIPFYISSSIVTSVTYTGQLMENRENAAISGID